MSKKKKQVKEVENKKVLEIDKPKLIDKYLKKYHRFDMLTYDVISSIIDKISIEGNNATLEAELKIDCAINLWLCEKVRNEEIDDIIILLEDQYHNMFNLILHKLGFPKDKIPGILEDVLLDVIYAYDGVDTFSLFYSKYAKKYLSKGEESKPTLDQILKDIPTLEKTDITTDDITYIGNQLQFIKNIPLDDPLFVKFVAYKFGFIGYYVADDIIKKYLNLSDDTFNTYLSLSYQYLNTELKNKMGIVSSIPKEKIKTSS